MSYTFVSCSFEGGSIIGYSQNLKLSMPLALSATAKKDFLSAPSTLGTNTYLLLNFMAPELKTAFMPNLSKKKGFVFSLKSKRQVRGVCAAVRTGFSKRS